MAIRIIFAVFACVLMVSVSFAQDAEATANLDAVQQYVLDNVGAMGEATQAYATTAQVYYNLLEESDFDYQLAWETYPEELTQLITDARLLWIDASMAYEASEGIVAGVPSLAYYDVWIDAGAPASEAPEEALDWELTLPNGDVWESPGNFFHNLTEPALWGTHEDFVGLDVDLDGDGEVSFSEVLPEANIFLGAALGLDMATSELLIALEEWEPTLEDAFTAMVIMVPTMNEYFGQWKESAFIAGDESESESFIALSRLVDISGILTGLDVTYDQVGVVVAEHDADLHAQIDIGFNILLTFVDDLYTQEVDGVVFTSEEVDFFGAEAQRQAEKLSALLAQAADELELEIVLE